jgi:hypothetical protein
MQQLQSQSVWAASIHPQLRRNPKIAEKLTYLTTRIEVGLKKEISIEAIAVQNQKLLSELRILIEALQKARNPKATDVTADPQSASKIDKPELPKALYVGGQALKGLPKAEGIESLSPEQYAYLDILTLLSFEIDFALFCITLVINKEIEISKERQKELEQFLIVKSRRYQHFMNEFERAGEEAFSEVFTEHER